MSPRTDPDPTVSDADRIATREAALKRRVADGAAVAALLTQSTAQHQGYRTALQAKLPTQAQLALAAAARLRQAAHDLDPDHTAPCWADEGSTHTQGTRTHHDLHTDLMAFYSRELEK